jgi:hypothetical protein
MRKKIRPSKKGLRMGRFIRRAQDQDKRDKESRQGKREE